MNIFLFTQNRFLHDLLLQCMKNSNIHSLSSIPIPLDLSQHNTIIIEQELQGLSIFIEKYHYLTTIINLTGNIYPHSLSLSKPFTINQLIDLITNNEKKLLYICEEEDYTVYLNYSSREAIKFSADINSGNIVFNLTEKEAEILKYISQHRTINRDELIDQVFGYKDPSNTHTLDTHFHRLRSKISPAIGKSSLASKSRSST